MTDLNDFDAGIDKDDPNPEDRVNQHLTKWLRGDDRSVYWDRDRSYGNGTFEISTRSSPDLLVTGKENNFAIEVKRSEDSGDIHNGAVQAFNYWKDIVENKAKYKIQNKKIDIDAVLLASDNSHEGHIFENFKKKDVMRSGRSEGAQRAAKIGEIPKIEYSTTETLIRLMYRFSKDYDEAAQVGIGGLVSSALDGDEPHINSADPAALYYVPGFSDKEDRRVQNWQYIPFYLKH